MNLKRADIASDKDLSELLHPRAETIELDLDKQYDQKLAELETLGLWRRVFGTEPMPYLPNHPEYGDKIKVQYFVYEVTRGR